MGTSSIRSKFCVFQSVSIWRVYAAMTRSWAFFEFSSLSEPLQISTRFWTSSRVYKLGAYRFLLWETLHTERLCVIEHAGIHAKPTRRWLLHVLATSVRKKVFQERTWKSAEASQSVKVRGAPTRTMTCLGKAFRDTREIHAHESCLTYGMSVRNFALRSWLIFRCRLAKVYLRWLKIWISWLSQSYEDVKLIKWMQTNSNVNIGRF